MNDLHPLQAFRESRVPPMSRKALADKIGVTDVSIWRWEKRERKPDRDLLEKINQVTGIPVAALIGVSEAAE